MSRDSNGTHSETRSSALWGTGNRGGDGRGNALWGKGGRHLIAGLAVLFVAAIPFAGAKPTPAPKLADTYVDPYLVMKAKNDPKSTVSLLIEASAGMKNAQEAFTWADHQDKTKGEDKEKVKAHFKFIDSMAVTLRSDKVLELANQFKGLTLTFDAKVKLTGSVIPTAKQIWPTADALRPFYKETELYRASTPTIAIVDSGIDKNRLDFDNGTRVIDNVVITKLQPNSPGDGRGHGTFVAGIAAGSAPDYAGAAPQAKIISLDVMDDAGMARTSDVIAAAEWIYQNRQAKNIKVANFSLHATTPSNFTTDALDKAVEKLWFSGVTVVVAAGNYGKPNGPSGVPFAPGNDPFVITVGAIDLDGSPDVKKHDVPNWSAWGYTLDGFRKPEISAAGRYMIGPVPLVSTLKTDKPENVVSPTYMRLSGTSFAAPVVAGAVAQILARHPDWTPDLVKGALIAKAKRVNQAELGAAGVGEINADKSADLRKVGNPNAALNRFVVSDPNGGSTPVFNAASWSDAAHGSVSWDDASWSDASWSDASWSDATWSDASWSDASWSDVSWSDVLAYESAAHEDAADDDSAPAVGDYFMTPEDEALALADPDLGLMPEPPPPPPVGLP